MTVNTTVLLRRLSSCLLGLVALCFGALTASMRAADTRAAAEELFAHRIQNLFKDKCLACHGDDETKIKGGLDMRSLAGLLKGGESEQPSVVPGKPMESPLYLAITREHEDENWSAMPPKENDKLSKEQIAYIKDWIIGGAPWPDEKRIAELLKQGSDKWAAKGGVVLDVGGLSPEWAGRGYKPEDLWAYQPIRKIGVMEYWSNAVSSTPALQHSIAPPHPVDAFLAAKMPAGLQPAPLADRATLVRRVTYDLIGLPPKPEEIAAFVADKDSDEQAFAKVVERLLASPHYGEKWGQHWLDVVRYADSSGFANDYIRGNAWRYRDYVIRSFNADKPYDQFVREQIAGDELDPKNPEMLIAAGFLRMGPWELTGMEVAKVARQRFLDDATDMVGQTFMAHMLQCARCHDHKFDPIPTKDYYSMQAVFATTQIAERDAPFLDAENKAGFEERKYLEARRREHLATLKRLDEKMVAEAPKFFVGKGIDPAQWNAAVAEAREQEAVGGAAKGQAKNKGRAQQREFVGAFNAARAKMQQLGVPEDQYPPKLYGFMPEDYGHERIARKGLERLKWEFDRYQPIAFSVYDGRTPDVKSINNPFRMPANRMEAGELEQTAILTGGDPFSAGKPVQPDVLKVVGALNPGLSATISTNIEGRRAALAQWVADPRNPLTPRVMVNRIWLWHFGQAIAGNPNNFGGTGKKPTHPELLDWLAATFLENGWSVKAMHRIILSSEAYRRAVTHPDPKALAEKDPNGTSYAVFKPRRLTAEEMRDAMLVVTGELNPTLGGIPNRPEMNLEAALQPRQVMGTFAEAWQPNPKPEQRHRRSIYALRIRGQLDPFMEVFNSPSPDLSCEAREASTVTPQVFSLFNGQVTLDRAVALAARLMKEAGETQSSKAKAQIIERAFQLAYGRAPKPVEIQACLDHWAAMTKRHQSLKLAKPAPPLEVVREAVEENTGEKFTFKEKLTAYEEFVPDLKLADVTAETRGLAEVCLVLFNANEFAYVY